MKVVDASVIYKWYASEEGSDRALDLLRSLAGGGEISTPDLALYEIANILRFSPAKSEADINFVLDNLTEHDIDIEVVSVPLLKEAARLALRHDITVYDAVYVALAQSLGCEFVTADKKLARRVSSLPFVKTL